MVNCLKGLEQIIVTKNPVTSSTVVIDGLSSIALRFSIIFTEELCIMCVDLVHILVDAYFFISQEHFRFEMFFSCCCHSRFEYYATDNYEGAIVSDQISCNGVGFLVYYHIRVRRMLFRLKW